MASHLEHIGFINKHQSGFRKAKSTDDHLFRLSQSIMESFNRGEHVVAAFLRSHLEHIGFINKHQSGFRKAKSTDDHLFRLSQSIMESFNRGEHVVAGCFS